MPAYGESFLPSNLTNLALWLRADDLGVGDGNAVSSWVSREGNSYDFTQGTGANQPTLDIDAIGGQPGVHFDGTDDYLAIANGFLTSNDGTVFIVARFDATSGAAILFGETNTGVTDYVSFGTDVSIAHRMEVQANSASTSAIQATSLVAVDTDYIFTLASDGSDSEISINGVSQTLNVRFGADNGDWFGDIASPNLIEIGRWFQNILYFDGKIAEIIVYSEDKSSAEKTQVTSYLKSRYSIT